MKTKFFIVVFTLLLVNLSAQTDRLVNDGNNISTTSDFNGYLNINTPYVLGLKSNGYLWAWSGNPGEEQKVISYGRAKHAEVPAFDISAYDSGGHSYLYNHGRRWGTHFYWTRGSNDGKQFMAEIGGDDSAGQYLRLYGETPPDDSKITRVMLRTKHHSYINPDGDYGLAIGLTAPPSGYRFAVDGKGIFEEVRVKPSENWPDYVFRPSYRLMSIEEKEAFTKAYHHLPSVAPEAVVMSEGMDVGKSHADLLKEVEEAHLYIFQLNKALQASKAGNDELRKIVNDLAKDVKELKQQSGQ